MVPACNAFMPKPIWNISGSKNGEALMAMRDRKPAEITERRNVGTANARRSSMGSEARRACRMLAMPATPPTHNMAVVKPALP